MPHHTTHPRAMGRTLTRRQMLQTATALGAGTVLAGTLPLPALASEPAGATACGESVQDILNLAYTIERAATTFYYSGMTSPPVVQSHKLAGPGGTLTSVSRAGNAANCANLQAALDQEQKHAQILANAGAVSTIRHFYFPASAFKSLGYTGQVGTFLWTLDHLETACIAVYLAALQRLGALGRPDLAVLCARNLAVESEHRALYRVISDDDPANNITLPLTAFTCAGDAAHLFAPYLTGHGFPPSVAVTHAIALPTRAQTARVIGRNVST